MKRSDNETKQERVELTDCAMKIQWERDKQQILVMVLTDNPSTDSYVTARDAVA